MNKLKLPVSIILLALCIAACSSNRPGSKTTSFELDDAYRDIQRIQAKADCIGPPGRYTSEIHSFENDYIFFHQKFKDRPGEFKAVLTGPETGYSFDVHDDLSKRLPKMSQQIVRGHDFHRIALFPDAFSTDLEFFQNTDYRSSAVEEYRGSDPNGNPASIFYDAANKVVAGVLLRNPADTSLTVEVYFSDWRDSDYGRLPYYAEVVQAQRETYEFNFIDIRINNMDAELFQAPEADEQPGGK